MHTSGYNHFSLIVPSLIGFSSDSGLGSYETSETSYLAIDERVLGKKRPLFFICTTVAVIVIIFIAFELKQVKKSMRLSRICIFWLILFRDLVTNFLSRDLDVLFTERLQ